MKRYRATKRKGFYDLIYMNIYFPLTIGVELPYLSYKDSQKRDGTLERLIKDFRWLKSQNLLELET